MNEEERCESPVYAEIKFFNAQMCHMLDILYNTGEHWDAMIHTDDGGSFKVHRCILAAASPYFRTVFTGAISLQTKTAVHDFTIAEVSEDGMSAILKYIYSGVLPLKQENVKDLLRLADYFLLPEAVRQCEKFLISRLQPGNCIGTYFLSKQYLCLNLRKEARQYFLKKNQTVSKREEFRSILGAEDLEDLLRDDELHVTTEEQVINLIDRWVQVDESQRKQFFPTLVLCARIGLCKISYLRGVIETHELVQTDESTSSHFLKMIEWLTLNNTSHDALLPFDEYFFRLRVPSGVIVVIGGWSRRMPTNIFEVYNIRANKWIKKKWHDNKPRAYYGITLMDDCIYCIGGFDGLRYYSSTKKFNIRTFKWDNLACMNESRGYVCAVTYRGSIYAIGGTDGVVRHNTCEIYNFEMKQWYKIEEMNCRRSDASAIVFKSHIYVAGGFNGEEWLSSVEIYNDETKSWKLVSYMPVPRGSHSLFIYRFNLYSVGGFDGKERLQAVEKYSIQTKTWSQVFEIKHPKSNFSTVVMEDKVFLIGGYDGARSISTVKVIREINGKWNEGFKAMKMNKPRNSLGACYLEHSMINIHDYISSDI